MPIASQHLQLPQRQTLAENTVQALLSHLDSGRWTDYLPGERELSEMFQISRPTLRQALAALERRGRLKASPGRRRRIIPLRGAGISIAGRSIVGLLSPIPLKSLPPFVLFWIDEVRSNLAKVGCRLEFHYSHASTVKRPDRALGNAVHSSPASVWILLLSTRSVQEWFHQRKLPCVVAGSCPGEFRFPSVDIDYRAACHHAVGVFHRSGHRRLALVIPTSGTVGDTESEAGVREGVITGSPPVIIRHDGTREDIMRRVEDVLQLPDPPTGFLVARSAYVLTVLTFLMQRGLKIPTEAAVICRDDDAFLDFVTPRVARYRTDPAAFARHLFHLILQTARVGLMPKKPIRLIPQFQPGATV